MDEVEHEQLADESPILVEEASARAEAANVADKESSFSVVEACKYHRVR